MTLTHGKRASPALVSSSEPLSTTMTSSRSPSVGRKVSRQPRVMSHCFQTGMTIDGAGRGAMRPYRSAGAGIEPFTPLAAEGLVRRFVRVRVAVAAIGVVHDLDVVDDD